MAKATLAGVFLGGQNDYSWPLVAGSSPHEARWEVTESVYKQLELYGGISKESPGLTLQIEREGAEPTVVKRLYIVDVFPGANAFTRRIRVVDRRYLWRLTHVCSTYNGTWATGATRVSSDGQNPETPDLLADIQWRRPTLQNEQVAWTANEVVKDVFRQVTGFEPIMRGNFEGLPVDDFEVDMSGHQAIEAVLALLPGAAVHINYDGQPVITDTRDGSEAAVYERFKDVQQGSLSVRVADRKWTRPSRYRVLFTPEIDIRFDYEEAPTGTTTGDEDTNKLHNVGQVTEPTGLTIGKQVSGPGSWEKLTDLFTAWEEGPGKRLDGGAARELSFDILRKHIAGDFRFLAPEFLYVGGLKGTGKPDPQWVRRLASAAHSYRKHFRIAKHFMQRLKAVRPVRATVISPNTGARASSPVYSDYTVRPAAKAFFTHSGADRTSGIAQRGYAELLTASTLQPAPVNVRMIHPQSGVFALEPKQTDARGYYEGVFLGYPDNTSGLAQGLPVATLGVGGIGTVVGGMYSAMFNMGWDWVDFEADWKFATIMSCVPASPNTTERLFAVDVAPSDLGLDPADHLGPPMTIRVYPGLVTARFSWNDSEGAQVVARIKGEGTDWPSQMVNRAHVEDVARASALRVAEALQDRPFGAMQVDMVADLEPTGAIQSVTQQMQGGATTTRIEFGTVRQPLDVWRFLAPETRRALLRSQLSLADPLGAALGF